MLEILNSKLQHDYILAKSQLSYSQPYAELGPFAFVFISKLQMFAEKSSAEF